MSSLFQCLPTLQEGIPSVFCRGSSSQGMEVTKDGLERLERLKTLEVAKDVLERLKWLKRLKTSLLEPSSDLWLKPGVVLKPLGGFSAGK